MTDNLETRVAGVIKKKDSLLNEEDIKQMEVIAPKLGFDLFPVKYNLQQKVWAKSQEQADSLKLGESLYKYVMEHQKEGQDMSNVIKLPKYDGEVDEFYHSLRSFIAEKGEGIILASVIGVLELVKSDIIQEANQ